MKKKVVIGVAVACLLVIGGLLTSVLRSPAPEKIVNLALENIKKANSFAYSIDQQQYVEGQKRQLARIDGYKSGENVHIQGQLIGSNVEMIKIKDTLYNKDPFSKEWIVFQDLSIAQKIFLVEIDPLSILQFKDIGEVVSKGSTELNNKKCWVYTFKPSVQNQMMERFWTDFEYTLYIAKAGKTLAKAEVAAKNKETQEAMTLALEFKDFGRKISIQPPEGVK
ncbi:MAG: hypothetical protein ACOX7U_04745 [Desulfitobacteriia bacterium]|jgi:hypothetical protein